MKEVKKKQESELGYPIHYARFHHPVPPGLNKEPVNEFVIKGKQTKYLVDSLRWTPEGVLYSAYGETNLVPSANVVYCRLTL